MGMNVSPKNQQIEFDVFPKDKKQKNSYPFDSQNDTTEEAAVNVVFSNQSVIVVIICAILLLITCFSLGVEKGKLLTKSDQKIIQTAQVEPMAQEIISPENDFETKNNKSVVEQKPAEPDSITTEKTLEPIFLQEKKEVIVKTGYTIQVASLKTGNSAKELTESLKKKGVPSFTKTSGEYTIVLAGNFKTKEAAQLQLKELKKTFNDCFIRKI